MGKIICGPDNVREFNARLRRISPEFHTLAKELHQAGLIQGLAGATIETDIESDEHAGDYADKSVKVCRQCRHWVRDSVGDGTGIGACEKGAMPGKLKWPGQTACKLFGELSND